MTQPIKEVIDVEVTSTDVMTTDKIYHLGLPVEELEKEIQKHAMGVLNEFAQLGASLDTVVTPDNRGSVKDLRAELNKEATKVKADLKTLKEEELSKFTVFEKLVLDTLHAKLLETSSHLDVNVKTLEKEMQEERVQFARDYWEELNKVTQVRPTYDDLLLKRSMNDTDNAIRKELTARHAEEAAEEARVASEINTLKMLPRSERLLELYDMGLTLAEVIAKDQEEEAHRQEIITREAERIAAEAEAKMKADRELAESIERERVRNAELAEEQRLMEVFIAQQQLADPSLGEPTSSTTAPIEPTPTLSTPEPLQAVQEPVEPIEVTSETALQEINLTVLGTAEQFNKLLSFADEVGMQITGKPVVKLAKVEDLF